MEKVGKDGLYFYPRNSRPIFKLFWRSLPEPFSIGNNIRRDLPLIVSACGIITNHTDWWRSIRGGSAMPKALRSSTLSL
ncbi:hypothetical protein [Microcystis aeruginosa]|uniref:hypothetical protein n=1 Tax=Microcystis aeruginosa TaxID=1126 RepID=UPI0013148A5B|nr:hypothetical protein [Microcystis aeruginosa]